MIVLFIFLAVLLIAFGYVIVAYLENAPEIDEDTMYRLYMEKYWGIHSTDD